MLLRHTTFVKLFVHNRRQLRLLKSLLHILHGPTEIYGLIAIGRHPIVLG